MSSRLPTLKARDVLRALAKAGFQIDRVAGGHYILRHPDRSGHVVVPYHANRDIKRGTLSSILKQAGLSVEEFIELL